MRRCTPSFVLAVLASGVLATVAGCGSSNDPVASTADHLEVPSRDDIQVVGTIAYGHTHDGLDCLTAVDPHPEGDLDPPKYCALKFEGGRFDQVRVSVTNTDSWGTVALMAFLLDDQFRLVVDPGAIPTSEVPSEAHFTGDENGNNSGKKVQFELTPGRQLKKTGTYYIVFAKHAIRDFVSTAKYKQADAFGIELSGTPAN
jgi:hypothetical protein